MSEDEFYIWLNENYSKYELFTSNVSSILKSLLVARGVAFLSVTGRTKDQDHCLEKLKRKDYEDPSTQMTDISGVRVVLFFEHDISKVSSIIEEVFLVDKENSVDQNDLLSSDQVGYRSVHYVCEFESVRLKLPDFAPYAKMKCEIQVRTILQHAWAELAHDRNYKFTGELPKPLERELFLLSGMLEVADSGFSRLSQEIDRYIADFSRSTKKGELKIEINALNLDEFVNQWAKDNNVIMKPPRSRADISTLIRELREFGITSIDELNKIIPKGFPHPDDTNPHTIFGVVRHWMMINDPENFIKKVNKNWTLSQSSADMLEKFIGKDEVKRIRKLGG